ncbi:MAG TPA: winged helix-turn-helix domain-containing protein [Caulobacteraceae bacterium]|nr:winged helix-turn-helix domain-containing protein [Caulobacteraceae bacterium]
MSQQTAISDRAAPIDLAREPDFALGPAQVHPPIGEVTFGGIRIRLQPRVMQVLVALARAEGEVVSRDDLLASCWGGLAIGEDSINRCIQRLRRLAETEAPGAFAIETLPRIGYRLGRAGDAAAPSPSPRRPRLRLWWIGAAGLAALAVAAAVWLALGMPGLPSGGQGVAVVPFDTPSGDTAARNFADGVSVELAGALAKSDIVSVPASSGPLSPLARDALSRRLGAAFTLAGRVQRLGDMLAVTVSLDDARRHRLLWSADFSRAASEAQDLQEEVAAKVAGILHCALAANKPGPGRLDLEALRLYLRACDAIDADEVDPTEVRDRFRAVVARQPKFAGAWANFALASAEASQALAGDDAAAAAAEARAAAHRALALDPRTGLAYDALARLAPQNDFEQRQQLILKGLAVTPDNAALNEDEADLMGDVGRLEDANTYAQRAVDLDPLNPSYASSLGYNVATNWGMTTARSMLERDVRIWPHNEEVRSDRFGAEARYGDPAMALRLLADPNRRPAPLSDLYMQDWRDFILARQSGNPSKVASYAAEVMRDVAARRLDVGSALVRLTALGAVDATYQAASKATPDDPVDTEPFFRPSAASVRADPRFLPLMAKTGVLRFWRRTGKWADFCQAENRPYDCRAMAAKLGF